MISSEVQRTLVKSPPELWAELSDPAALARHLGELGEIRITRTEPEKLVEWEAEGATGTVAIKASGWGTKVTLTVARELPASDPTSDAETQAEAETEASGTAAASTLEDAQTTPEPPIVTAAERFAPDFPPSLRGDRPQAPHQETAEGHASPEVVPEPPASPEETAEPHASPEEVPEPPASQAPTTQSTPATIPRPDTDYESAQTQEDTLRPGFFARLFGRGRKRSGHTPPATSPAAPTAPDPSLSIPPADESTPLAPNPIEPAKPQILPPPASEADADPPAPTLSAELLAAEEATAEVTAVLTAVLDRLGAAHHRPFSRS